MNIISKTISVINPNQTPVDTCDQPVYTLTKQIQWRYPELFGNQLNIFCYSEDYI